MGLELPKLSGTFASATFSEWNTFHAVAGLHMSLGMEEARGTFTFLSLPHSLTSRSVERNKATRFGRRSSDHTNCRQLASIRIFITFTQLVSGLIQQQGICIINVSGMWLVC